MAEDIVLGELGALLLDGGSSVTDVRGSLEQVQRRSGTGSDLRFAVLPELVLVSRAGVSASTSIAYAGAKPLTFRQSAHANRLARDLEAGRRTLSDAPQRIAEIRSIRERMPATANILGIAILSMGLAALVRCPWWAILLAFFVGALVGTVTNAMSRVRSAAAIAPFVSALVSTVAVGAFAGWLGLGPVPLFAVCAPIAILVPGAIITNGLLELTSTDIVTGASRLVYGLIMLAFMAAGVFAGAHLTGLRIDSGSAALVAEAAHSVSDRSGWEALPPLWLSWIGVVLLAVGIGLAFGAGHRLTLVSVAVMTGTYAVLVLLTPVLGNAVATGLTAALLFVAARALERLTLAIPATVSFQSAFLLLVPGTVGLVALASFDASALASAPMIFLSLCIGTKVGALTADLAHITRTALRTRRRTPVVPSAGV